MRVCRLGTLEIRHLHSELLVGMGFSRAVRGRERLVGDTKAKILTLIVYFAFIAHIWSIAAIKFM